MTSERVIAWRAPGDGASQRYERGSLIITTNKAYKNWPEIFNHDAGITSAILDRVLHHAETVVIEG